jgi:hypothetical protein
VYALALHDEKARSIFEKRLAEPGISVRDKGLTYAAAVQAFADHNRPARIATAETYMKSLDALPQNVSGQEAAQSHMILGNTYRLVNKPADEIMNDKKGLEIAQKLTQQERAQLLIPYLIDTYGDLAEAYVAEPNSKPRIDSIAVLVQKPVNPDVPDVKMGLDAAVKRGYLLGKPAPDIFSNHWFNIDGLDASVKPTSGTMALKGNVPHLVEFTQFG